jgi:A/G-specific adenine glycosylase
MEHLPDVRALADASEDELLKLWEGLGYYNRIRNMQKAAMQVLEEYDGVLPADYEALLRLKGIGSYTAGAIASIAYGIPVPAVDGNVLRILTRVTADDTDIMKQSFRREVELALEAVIRQLTVPESVPESVPKSVPEALQKKLRNGNVPGALNQALMELGATVCLPNGEPLCAKCPWQEMCLGKAQERIGDIPVKSKAKARRIEKRTVLIIREQDRVAIRKRPNRGLLAGLYELPNVEGHLTAEETLEQIKQLHYQPIRIQKLEDAKHIFSHIEWHMTGYAIRVEEPEFSEAATGNPDLIFVEAEDAKERYAIPSAFAAYAGYMNIKLGNERFEK